MADKRRATPRPIDATSGDFIIPPTTELYPMYN